MNCNSSKGDKDVQPEHYLLPDRDNTFAALSYQPDGSIEPSPAAIAAGLQAMANETLRLVGLDKAAVSPPDQNGRQVALDRASQRMEVWLKAQDARNELLAADSPALRKATVSLAIAEGFFSVWMTVFQDDADMRLRLIAAFPGTLASGCFNPASGVTTSPAPNPDNLPDGGKI